MIELLLTFILIGSQPKTDVPQVAVTIAPLATIVNEVVKGRGEVLTLLPAGASPHTYEARPSDAKKLAGAKAFFYVAHSLDGWAANLPSRRKQAVLELLPPGLQLKALIHGHAHDRRENAHHSEDHGPGEPKAMDAVAVDPHFWTDPLAVKAVLPGIAETMCAVDPEACPTYRKNVQGFSEKLDALHGEMDMMFKSSFGKPVLFSHPFFLYFLKRYGFNNVEILVKAPGSEPSPKDVAKAIAYTKDNNIRTVFALKQLSKKPAELIVESAGIKMMVLDPIGLGESGSSYFDLIRRNAGVLLEGLK